MASLEVPKVSVANSQFLPTKACIRYIHPLQYTCSNCGVFNSQRWSGLLRSQRSHGRDLGGVGDAWHGLEAAKHLRVKHGLGVAGRARHRPRLGRRGEEQIRLQGHVGVEVWRGGDVGEGVKHGADLGYVVRDGVDRHVALRKRRQLIARYDAKVVSATLERAIQVGVAGRRDCREGAVCEDDLVGRLERTARAWGE